MKVILTGATGFVGEGVLLACLQHPEVERVLVVGRRSCGYQHPKLEEYLLPDLLSIPEGDPRLADYDACFFCAGITSVGTPADQYRQISYEIPLHLAQAMGPGQKKTFIYVSGAGTGTSKQAWGTVKRQTEADLQTLGFGKVFLFRPAIMLPTPGQRYFTLSALKMLKYAKPFWRLFSSWVNDMDQVGRAMIELSKTGYTTPYIEVSDIHILAPR